MSEKNILVIDDEKDIVSTIEYFFTKQGHKVSVALCGEEAIKKLEFDLPQLVILDMKMPGLDGPSLLKIINDKYPNTKIIILTGYGDEYQDKIKNLKYQVLLTKPFSTTEVVETAKTILEGKELPKENLLYKDPYIMPQAKLLFIEPNELAYGGKAVYFASLEKSGGKYEITAMVDTSKIEEKLQSFNPDIIIGDIFILGSSTDLRSKITTSVFKPKDIILHGSSSDKVKDPSIIEGQFDPLTAIFVKGMMDKLGKAVRQSCINNNLYTKTENPVKIPGLEPKQEKPSDIEKRKELKIDDIPDLVKEVLSNHLKVSKDNIKDNTHLVKNLGMDSLQSVEITLDLEEAVGFEIPDGDAERLNTYKQIVAYLKKHFPDKKNEH
jgi:acyl carrier protein